jgi:hypothetical protein
MKLKFGNIKLEAIQELNKNQQKAIQGGGGVSSPCCPSSPYYNHVMCRQYANCNNPNFTGGYSWCTPTGPYAYSGCVN